MIVDAPALLALFNQEPGQDIAAGNQPWPAAALLSLKMRLIR
jgi:PIN domain nuclease of toxin-antitoxin system